ncbi:ectoine/hydroxyectoine ABC transporter substrate-binding protein EhuB [Virgibacillus sp. MSJ-26]|uniref:ectoine/hydroxyectoine ABC transporter substrate-binding protein EhuB n=1 Tax=Virgibacillus sp. MSJ-26 TaxID=2841522 RepID=UPI001C100735|nr:ectoine/hydroxyectoine ABC transporter substrate-binding protein EhuB [Virgibacillus sp. MSJ-26]MBU5467557.1 ectoine/hydroxyectoine ABC transporter substrate-binding protein EhuB [Virgibacillus sp. MSJ-26]
MRNYLLAPLIIFSIIFLAACGSDETSGNDGEKGILEELQEKGTVKVGFANEEPYGYQNDDGEITGASVETAKAVFKELGIDDVEGHLTDYDQLVSGLAAKKFDAITSGMAITPDRCENVAFAEPDMKYGEGLIVKKGNPLDLHSYEDIADNPDVVVSVMSGATENDFLKSEGVDPDQIQSAPDIPATFSAVESDRADATTGTEMTIKMALESADTEDLEFVEDFEQPDIEGVPSYGAVAFHPEHQELLDAFNEKLQELKDDGTVEEILEDNGFSGEMNFPEDDVTAEMVCDGEE